MILNFIKVLKKINEMASDYEMSDFQRKRKEIKGLKREHKNIFREKPGKSVHLKSKEDRDNSYAYHWGGRDELQFNVLYDGNKPLFRYGVAFSLKRDINLQNPVEKMKPKIEKYNEYMKENASEYQDINLYTDYEKNKYSSLKIEDDLIEKKAFLFIGRYEEKKLENFDEEYFHKILSLFDRLLPVYLYVESGDEFSFEISGSEPEDLDLKTITSAKYSKKQVEVNLRHNKMINNIVKQLGEKYGMDNVSTEETAKSGGQIDIALTKNSSNIFYEVKTSQNIKYCIRKAVGQLLEYSYYPDECFADKLIVVSSNKINETSKEYLENLRKTLDIPIYYQRYNEKKEELENTIY